MKKPDYLVQNESNSFLIEKSGYNEKNSAYYTRELSNQLVDELVSLRKSRHMTQQDIADIIGMPRANISRIERKLYTPTLALLMKYANSLGKTLRIELIDLE